MFGAGRRCRRWRGRSQEIYPLASFPREQKLGSGYVLLPKVTIPIKWTFFHGCSSPYLLITTISLCPFRSRISMFHQRMLPHSLWVPSSLLTSLQIALLLNLFFFSLIPLNLASNWYLKVQVKKTYVSNSGQVKILKYKAKNKSSYQKSEYQHKNLILIQDLIKQGTSSLPETNWTQQRDWKKGSEFWQKTPVEGIGNKIRDKLKENRTPLIYRPYLAIFQVSKSPSSNLPHCIISSTLPKPSTLTSRQNNAEVFL